MCAKFNPVAALNIREGLPMAEKPDSRWFEKILLNLFDAHFLLGAGILLAWILIISKPLGHLGNIPLNETSAAKEQFSLIVETVAGLSAVFSTALGFVLGHFFGKHGIDSAEKRASQAISEKERIARTEEEMKKVAESMVADIERKKQREQQVEEIEKRYGDFLKKVEALRDTVAAVIGE
jgi:hypothetical protein